MFQDDLKGNKTLTYIKNLLRNKLFLDTEMPPLKCYLFWLYGKI